jgi:hypothetical protein
VLAETRREEFAGGVPRLEGNLQASRLRAKATSAALLVLPVC